MPIRRSILPLHLIAIALVVMVSAVRAQWVVYDFRIHTMPEVSENFAPYSGVYVIAPVTGGNASMIFITEEGGRFYNVAENGARYFTAASPTGRLSVVSAIAQTGTARVMYQAVGLLNSSISYTVRGEHQGGRVSTDMLGTMLASDDESLAVAPSPDGSIGMVGSAQLAGTLRLDLSRILNQNELQMSQAVASITDLLEKYGYQFDSPDHGQAAVSEAAPAAGGEPAPAPAPATPEQPATDASLFPPGTREELELSLNPPESN
ncbi:MAG: hypothetical protein JNM99_03930 [Verrucomicrobiaceae bacterium]|nr:hypothetical protein [Verrucomicrobiaceae bacterium]